MQDEQDPAQRLPVIQTLTPGMTEPALDHRQEWLDPLPQATANLPRLTYSPRLGCLAPNPSSLNDT